MFEERLKDLITDLYSGRILVVSNYGARETLFTKGITPAILLHKYYSLPVTESRVVYTVKERSVRELCSLSPIDLEEYGPFKEDRVNKLIKDKLIGKSKLPKQIQKEDLSSKQHI